MLLEEQKENFNEEYERGYRAGRREALRAMKEKMIMIMKNH